MSYKGLIIGFARSGVLGFGGGPSTIPLIRFETVEKYKLIDDEQFGEVLALANALPGPIATKMAAYIGYKVKGTSGSVVAILAHILPSIVVLLSLVSSLYALRGSPVVEGMIQGIGPIIAVMLGVMAYEFVQKSWKGLGVRKGTELLLLSAAILVLLKLHPAIAITVFLGAAFAHSSWRNRREKGMSAGMKQEAAATDDVEADAREWGTENGTVIEQPAKSPVTEVGKQQAYARQRNEEGKEEH